MGYGLFPELFPSNVVRQKMSSGHWLVPLLVTYEHPMKTSSECCQEDNSRGNSHRHSIGTPAGPWFNSMTFGQLAKESRCCVVFLSHRIHISRMAGVHVKRIVMIPSPALLRLLSCDGTNGHEDMIRSRRHTHEKSKDTEHFDLHAMSRSQFMINHTSILRSGPALRPCNMQHNVRQHGMVNRSVIKQSSLLSRPQNPITQAKRQRRKTRFKLEGQLCLKCRRYRSGCKRILVARTTMSSHAVKFSRRAKHR